MSEASASTVSQPHPNLEEQVKQTEETVDKYDNQATTTVDDPEAEDPNIQFKPLVQLPLVEIRTLEEDEEELFKMRAKLYRFETSAEGERPEWKERGLGDVKLLRNPKNGTVRILMRREKTLKLCANHYITPFMELKPYLLSEKAFIWTTAGDFSDGEAKSETLCIRFGTLEKTLQFKTAFENAKEWVMKEEANSGDDSEVSKGNISHDSSSAKEDDLVDSVAQLNINNSPQQAGDSNDLNDEKNESCKENISPEKNETTIS